MFNKLLTVGVVVALILGGVALAQNKTVIIDEGVDPATLAGIMTYNPTPEINLGGIRLVGLRKSLATGTSTVCAIQSPSATSTLISGVVNFTLASTSAVEVDISKGTTQYATSTNINSRYAIGASKQATIVASSTGSVAGDATIFAPNTWFIVKYNDVYNGVGDASTGSCSALWQVARY